MNERIRELALQANPASKKIYESDSWQFNCAAWSAEDLEKFAKLIVRECIDILYTERGEPHGTERDFAVVNAALKISRHFGGEE